MTDLASERCSWCGRAVGPDGGFRLGERPGERRAVFCRLEHVVPWAIQGPRWGTGDRVDHLDRSAMAGCRWR